MKYPTKRQFPAFVSRRPYRLAAVSALVVASTTGVLLARPAGNPGPDTPTLTAELNRAGVVQPAGQAAPSPTPPVTPSAGASSPASGAPSPAATTASPAATRAAATSSPDPDLTPKPTPVKPPASKVLGIEYQEQITYYYCGPAAVRIALTARGVERTQDDLAVRLNTTEFGTNSAADTTRVLNDLVGRDVYRTRMIPGGAATPAQMDRLQADVVSAVSRGYAVVVNIAGSATDVDGGWHSFPGGHYLTVVGYRDGGRTVKIADPANAAAGSYWMTTITLANWAATRGYSA